MPLEDLFEKIRFEPYANTELPCAAGGTVLAARPGDGWESHTPKGPYIVVPTPYAPDEDCEGDIESMLLAAASRPRSGGLVDRTWAVEVVCRGAKLRVLPNNLFCAVHCGRRGFVILNTNAVEESK